MDSSNNKKKFYLYLSLSIVFCLIFLTGFSILIVAACQKTQEDANFYGLIGMCCLLLGAIGAIPFLVKLIPYEGQFKRRKLLKSNVSKISISEATLHSLINENYQMLKENLYCTNRKLSFHYDLFTLLYCFIYGEGEFTDVELDSLNLDDVGFNFKHTSYCITVIKVVPETNEQMIKKLKELNVDAQVNLALTLIQRKFGMNLIYYDRSKQELIYFKPAKGISIANKGIKMLLDTINNNHR